MEEKSYNLISWREYAEHFKINWLCPSYEDYSGYISYCKCHNAWGYGTECERTDKAYDSLMRELTRLQELLLL